ncbi:MAG: shikimate kinase [Suipraeoptans sp.]
MRNIVFIGFMGVGKSTIAYKISKMRRMKIIDTDKEIEKKVGMKVADIFEKHGEEYFRDMETNLLYELQGERNLLISCGGGVVLREKNREIIHNTGTVVLLSASAYTIHNRVSRNDRRPLARGKSRHEISKMLKSRQGFYKESADVIVSINHKTVSMICSEVLRKVEEFNKNVK